MRDVKRASSPRSAPMEMSPTSFREVGHELVDRIADLLAAMPAGPVTPGEMPADVRRALGQSSLPKDGRDANALLRETADLLAQHSLFNGHPRFLGFITSSAAPIGALADLLAASVNPNLGGWLLSPMASEIEAQSIRWIAELIGYPSDCGGILVSGGNVANFVGFWAARRAKGGDLVRTDGAAAVAGLRVYASSATHTWLEKIADLSGLGTRAIHSIPVDPSERLDAGALRSAIEEDLGRGLQPFMVVGSAGTVSTGAIDPLADIASICREFDLWFHIDGAYGAPAAAMDNPPADLRSIREADSVAVDPHKWLYAPLEAGAVLVRDNAVLRDTFSYHPPYYPDKVPDDESGVMYYELGPQNSRGFRALKVWLGLKQVGREGYRQMITEDVRLARVLFDEAQSNPELEAVTHNLSITTFRYVPEGLPPSDAADEDYLNDLNRRLLVALQQGGEVFLSNAVLDDRYLLRACVVNFRTSEEDIRAIPEIVVRVGRGLR
ncbi:MAG: aminotransferase class V-fold PLP-dependent enzyme [Rhodothermia bacterium]|nr:aminotransferase class V-fold PLP-dependent enzyme [Rhodothermia bacterium]